MKNFTPRAWSLFTSLIVNTGGWYVLLTYNFLVLCENRNIENVQLMLLAYTVFFVLRYGIKNVYHHTLFRESSLLSAALITMFLREIPQLSLGYIEIFNRVLSIKHVLMFLSMTTSMMLLKQVFLPWKRKILIMLQPNFLQAMLIGVICIVLARILEKLHQPILEEIFELNGYITFAYAITMNQLIRLRMDGIGCILVKN